VGRTVAAFDFDGTLTRRDTLVPFLVRVAGYGRVVAALVAETPRFALVAAGRAGRDEAKERLLVRVLAGRPAEPVRVEGERYGKHLAAAAITSDMRVRVQRHLAADHDVVLLSAALDVYLETVGRELGVHATLCTRLEVDDRDCFTGRILGANCRGDEKARRLRDHLQGAEVTVWAYGDSRGDEEMLALADYPVRVRRGQVRDGASITAA
jgi:phosphatidylglycerophosphatase C